MRINFDLFLRDYDDRTELSLAFVTVLAWLCRSCVSAYVVHASVNDRIELLLDIDDIAILCASQGFYEDRLETSDDTKSEP